MTFPPLVLKVLGEHEQCPLVGEGGSILDLGMLRTKESIAAKFHGYHKSFEMHDTSIHIVLISESLEPGRWKLGTR